LCRVTRLKSFKAACSFATFKLHLKHNFKPKLTIKKKSKFYCLFFRREQIRPTTKLHPAGTRRLFLTW
jgi:hypothetical protein